MLLKDESTSSEDDAGCINNFDRLRIIFRMDTFSVDMCNTRPLLEMATLRAWRLPFCVQVVVVVVVGMR